MIKKKLDDFIIVYRFEDYDKVLSLIKKSEQENTNLLNPTDENYQHFPLQDGNKWVSRHELGNHIGFFHNDSLDENLLFVKNKYPDSEECLYFQKVVDFYNNAFSDYLNEIKDLNILKPYISTYTFDKTKVKETRRTKLPGWENHDMTILKHSDQNNTKKYDSFSKPIWGPNNHPEGYLGGMTLGLHYDIMIPINKPGRQHAVTANLYLNDNYDEGHIIFLYTNNLNDFENKNNYKMLVYKPKAGDIIFYPSQEPCLHGVSPAFNKDRYFISKIFAWNYDGSMNEKIEKDYFLGVKDIIDSVQDMINESNYTYINGKDFWF